MNWTAWGLETAGETEREGHNLVRAEAESDGGRTPVVVNLLLDRSGSMKGAPMAAAVEAAQQLVDQSGPEDFLGLVVFDAVAEQRVPVTAMNEHFEVVGGGIGVGIGDTEVLRGVARRAEAHVVAHLLLLLGQRHEAEAALRRKGS